MPVDRVIKYEAAAGSGKTYQLTFEYLKQVIRIFAIQPESVLASGDADHLIGSILAITFTNKAANEMKERILEKLKKFSLVARKQVLMSQDENLLEKLSRALKLDRNRIICLSEQVIERIISHYHDFNVKTIDSLMSSIIKVISPDLNLQPDFEIGVEAEDELRSKAVEFIETICQQDWEFLRSVLSNVKNSETLDQWYIDETIIRYLVEFYTLAQTQGIGENGSSPPDTGRLSEAVGNLKDGLSALLSLVQDGSDPESVHPGINRKLMNASLIASMVDFVKDISNLKKIDAVIHKKLFSLDDCTPCFKKDADSRFRDEFSRQFQETKDRLSKCILLLSLNRVSHFSQFFSDFVSFWEDRRGTIYVNEFSRTLRRKLVSWEKSALPYIYLKLSDRFRHFLFDEFQDTSELQFQALVPILEEVMASEEQSSIFLVGDRKQAIYRWRGGNAELMNEKRLRKELDILNWLVPEPGTFTQVLDHNFRSRKNIVSFNNLFWNPPHLKGMLESLGAGDRVIQMVQDNFESAVQKFFQSGNKKGGYVQVSRLEYRKSESESFLDPVLLLFEKCEQLIKDLFARRYRGTDIALLTRSNEEGRDLVRFLESRDIQTISDESLYLMSSVLINEIISFFRFIDYPPDHLNLFTFISGNIFKKRAEILFPGEMEKFDVARLTGVSSGIPLYKRCRELIPETWENLIDPFVKKAGFSPPYDIFQDVTLAFQLFENFPDSSPFFLSFGSMLHDLERDDVTSISALVTEWEKNCRGKNPYSINVADDESRVRVLTIHKAKGLEFPIVIIPLKSKSGRGDKNLFWSEGKFYHIAKDYARINPHLRNLYIHEIEKGFIDELNLLYVAFTRAKDGLFIPFIHQPPRSPVSPDPFRRVGSFSDMLANHPWILEKLNADPGHGKGDSWTECTWGERLPIKDETMATRMPAEYLFAESKKISTSEWQKEFLVFSSTDLFGIEEKKSIERGEAIHRLFARIEKIPQKNRIEAVLRPIAETEKIREDDYRMLARYLARDDVFCFFKGDIQVFREKDIAGYVGDQIEYRRVDRLVINGDRIQVVDFKTGSRKTEQHIQQIKEYLQIIKSLFPERKFEGYLLYPDRNEVERI